MTRPFQRRKRFPRRPTGGWIGLGQLTEKIEDEDEKCEVVFKHCNVCGRSLVRDDELQVGMCAICANEELPAL